MTAHRLRAERASWTVIADTVAITIGFASPLHKAALKAARTGAEADAAEFYARFEELSLDAAAKFTAALQALDARRDQVLRAYARSGRV